MAKKKTKKPAKKSRPAAKKTAASRTTITKKVTSSVGFTPAGDRLLVRPLTPDESGTMTSFGIIIPDSAKEKPEQGIIVAVGAGKKGDDGKLVPLSFEVGEKVMFNKYGYDEIKLGGKDYFIVSEQNILGVIN